MTDIAQKIDEIARRAVDESFPFARTRQEDIGITKSAIYEAIEAVLMMEPSDSDLVLAVDTYTAYQNPMDRGYAQQEQGMRLAYRAMTAALLEEIRKERKNG